MEGNDAYSKLTPYQKSILGDFFNGILARNTKAGPGGYTTMPRGNKAIPRQRLIIVEKNKAKGKEKRLNELNARRGVGSTMVVDEGDPFLPAGVARDELPMGPANNTNVQKKKKTKKAQATVPKIKGLTMTGGGAPAAAFVEKKKPKPLPRAPRIKPIAMGGGGSAAMFVPKPKKKRFKQYEGVTKTKWGNYDAGDIFLNRTPNAAKGKRVKTNRKVSKKYAKNNLYTFYRDGRPLPYVGQGSSLPKWQANLRSIAPPLVRGSQKRFWWNPQTKHFARAGAPGAVLCQSHRFTRVKYSKINQGLGTLLNRRKSKGGFYDKAYTNYGRQKQAMGSFRSWVASWWNGK